MPSRYTAGMSNDLAQEQCDALGVRLLALPIEKPFQGFLDALADAFEGREPDTTEENLQSRTRGALLMALSNKFGGLVLTTGNKSEYAVGYATIYGDMRSEEHTSELQSLMRISYAVFCLKKKTNNSIY